MQRCHWVHKKNNWNSGFDVYVIQISIQVVSKLLLTLGHNSISLLWADCTFTTGKTWTGKWGAWGSPACDQYGLEKKAAESTCGESKNCTWYKKVLAGIWGQLEQIGFLVMTYWWRTSVLVPLRKDMCGGNRRSLSSTPVWTVLPGTGDMRQSQQQNTQLAGFAGSHRLQASST